MSLSSPVDRAALEKAGRNNDKEIEKILEENRQLLNQSIASFAQVAMFELLEGDFEKNSKTKSIKALSIQLKGQAIRKANPYTTIRLCDTD